MHLSVRCSWWQQLRDLQVPYYLAVEYAAGMAFGVQSLLLKTSWMKALLCIRRMQTQRFLSLLLRILSSSALQEFHFSLLD